MPCVNFPEEGVQASVPSGSDLQEIAQKHPHLPFKFGCRQGQCGVCALKVLEGMENLTQRSENEQKTLQSKQLDLTHRLACQCALNGDVSLARCCVSNHRATEITE